MVVVISGGHSNSILLVHSGALDFEFFLRCFESSQALWSLEYVK